MKSVAFDHHLRKHSEYQRVYREGRKQFSASMSYFYADRGEEFMARGPRIGLTAGRVLGKAVERNRIKRRMRAAVRSRIELLTRNVDLVLHPRRSVLAIDFRRLQQEIERIFVGVQAAKAINAVSKSGKDNGLKEKS